MTYTMADFNRDYVKEHFVKLTPEEQAAALQALPARKRAALLQSLSLAEQEALVQSLPPARQAELLQSLPPEQRLAGLSEDQIRHYLDQLTSGRASGPRKPRRKR